MKAFTMTSERCSEPECNREVASRMCPVWKRQIVNPAVYCEEHAEEFLYNYEIKKLSYAGPRQRWGDAVGFDIELVVLQDIPNIPCKLFLREVGCSRLFECETGIFEAAAIQWELEKLATPRPLTHRAMASLITAFGGRLECVLVDKLSLAERMYEAKLHIISAKEKIVVDVRVSDAVALALICETPIYVSDEVLTLM